MSLLIDAYRKNFLRRYDKDDAIPYYSAGDFPGLDCEEGAFENSAGVTIRWFTDRYGGYDQNKLILFCPGIGPGHTAYLAEIETLCRAGYRVLTLDYTGCGASGGERLPSLGAPTRDAAELLERLKPTEEIIPVGHSLGGYTALNLARLTPEVRRAVILSGFLSVADEMRTFVKSGLLARRVQRYEAKTDPRCGAPDNRAYLARTTDRILWIHSTDDPMVNFRYNAGRVLKTHNPNVRVIAVKGKKHNPQYLPDAVETMNAWIGEYTRLTAENKLDTPAARKAYFADKPIARMTAQDPAVYAKILTFIGD